MLDESRLEKLKKRGSKITARFPACAEGDGDRKGDHLSIDELRRFSCVLNPGADGAAHRKRIFELVGIPESSNGNAARKQIVSTYDYTDENGALLFQVCRFEPKDFRQRRPDASAKDG